MWIDKNENARGHNLYPKTVDALQNFFANLIGEWGAEVAITADNTEVFYLMAADQEMDWDDVAWEEGLSVMCVIRYGDEGSEKETECEIMVTFQTYDGEDHVKELEIIAEVLKAWVEEKSFPNARMAVNVRELLRVDDIQDYLAAVNYSSYYRSRAYQVR